MKCMVTGHRPNKLNSEYDYNGPITCFLKNNITRIIREKKPVLAISGMAIGVDTLFAMICLNEGIPLLAAVPFEGQESKWPKKARDLYYKLLNDPLTNVHIVCSGPYLPYKMQLRNIWMADQLVKDDFAIAVFDGSKGGTANCVKYLKSKKKKIIRIDPSIMKYEKPEIQKINTVLSLDEKMGIIDEGKRYNL